MSEDQTGTTSSQGPTEYVGPKVLERAFAILSLFTPDSPEWTVTEAAQVCHLPVPTAHRILTALHHLGYISRDQYSKRYRLGIAALELGRHARASIDIRGASVPVLESISKRTSETALLTAVAQDGVSSVCLERVESRNPLRLSVEPGRRSPLHAGASQKALLAHLPEKTVAAVLDRGLPALCKATITNAEALRSELDTIRRRGWATSYQETDLGLWGIAIALLDGDGMAVAAVGLAGPRIRLPKSRVSSILETLDGGAREIAAAVGVQTSTQVAGIRRTIRSRNGAASG